MYYSLSIYFVNMYLDLDTTCNYHLLWKGNATSISIDMNPIMSVS